MNFLLEQYPFVHQDDDLIYFDGIAVQKNRSKSVEYDADYFDKYVGYEGTPISIRLNENRVAITEKYCEKSLLDIGIGSGEFIKSSNLKTYGFDINPFGVTWLKSRDLYVNPYEYLPSDIGGWTFWDSLEHFSEPQDILTKIPVGHYAFISIPICRDVLEVKEWKHYRPDEHYYYFTEVGLIEYMRASGFKFFECNNAEIEAGRQDILTFVFLRSCET